MKNTVNSLFLELTQGASGLPSLAQYRVFGAAKTAGEPYSATGDLDGDGRSNIQELDDVIPVDRQYERALFVEAATDPLNFWPGNDALPVGSAVSLSVLSSLLALGGAWFAARRRE